MNATTRSSLPADVRYIGPHDPNATVDVTLVFRHRAAPPAAAWPHAAMSRADYAAQHGADPADVERVRALSKKHGMRELDCHMDRRTLHLSGTAQSMKDAFGVDLGQYAIGSSGAHFVGCAQEPTLPDPAIIAVLGLDKRPVATAHFRKPLAQPINGFTPLQLGELYQFPAGTDGSGQTIAIIELGGGYQQADLDTYFSGLGIKGPTVTSVSVDGASNTPGGDADGEVMLDIEVAGALAPGAKFVVYFAANTDQGFYNAIAQAAHDATNKPTVISISWGGPEDSWAPQGRDALESALQDAIALGITVTVAAGDAGSTDGETDGKPHVDFPSSSPSVLACGGTRLTASGSKIASEVVWNETATGNGATGGGVSAVYPLPTWQASSKVPTGAASFNGRGVPDVAGDADPLTGYKIRVDGKDVVYGGTSAVAPLWAALVARLNQALGTTLGDGHAALYRAGKAAFHDITQGNNGTYKAAAGWDACTGLGSPNGEALLKALRSASGGSASGKK
ncbi:S53 family peptidase [Rhodanobacter sp. BL-MT-08]